MKNDILLLQTFFQNLFQVIKPNKKCNELFSPCKILSLQKLTFSKGTLVSEKEGIWIF